MLCTLNNLQAQNAPLNKQQTLDYIEKLYKASRSKDTRYVIASVTLDFKTLQVNYSTGTVRRAHLEDNRLLEVYYIGNDEYNVSYEASNESKDIIFSGIQNESDANKLKKALTHLIEILKTEKNTDPFGN
ncbi:MAG: hypothetical protein RL308_1614 [Bacteroidota bacterium]